MPFQKKAPPTKLILDSNFYNLLLGILVRNENAGENSISEKATKLKDKLLRYSSPYISKDDKKMVRIGFFNTESSDMMSELLTFINSNCTIEQETDYYAVLQKVRETNIAKKEE